MPTTKLPPDFDFLPEMYADSYFPPAQVDKVKAAIQQVVAFLEQGHTNSEAVQQELDDMTLTINELQNDFVDAGSEIESMARDAIADTVERVLAHFGVDIDIEEALQEREW